MISLLLLVHAMLHCTIPTTPILPASSFKLDEVRLLDGPLKQAQDADIRYLLQLNPDAFLNPYLRAVGLPPKAPFYGGWESRNDGNAGEVLGHYLTAISDAWAITHDPRFKQRADHIVDELETCQNRREDGALFYDARLPEAWAQISQGHIKVDNPFLNGIATWYRVHKILTGLMDAHRLCRNQKALQIAIKLGDWACNVTRNLSAEQWQTMLEAEFGGINDALVELTEQTENPKYAELALRFHHNKVCDPLAARNDNLAGLHANTQIPKIIGEARIYERTGDPVERAIAENFWSTVVRHLTYAIGGTSKSEFFGLADRYAEDLAEDDCETCCTYNMQKLTRRLFTWGPRAEYGDWYEKAQYNHILGSQDPETGMMTYFVPLKSGLVRKYCTPFDSFWCCVATGMENHLLHANAIYYKHLDDHLWVNLFAPSEVDWTEAGLKLRQETQFPQNGAVVIRVLSGSEHKAAISIRMPAWSTGKPTIKLSGKLKDYTVNSDGFITITHLWRAGDHLDIQFGMGLRIEPAPGNAGVVSLAYGPLVLSGDMGDPISTAVPNDMPSPPIPVLTLDKRPIDDWLKRLDGETLAFRSVNAVHPHDLIFRPFAELRRRRTATYFKAFRTASGR